MTVHRNVHIVGHAALTDYSILVRCLKFTTATKNMLGILFVIVSALVQGNIC